MQKINYLYRQKGLLCKKDKDESLGLLFCKKLSIIVICEKKEDL